MKLKKLHKKWKNHFDFGFNKNKVKSKEIEKMISEFNQLTREYYSLKFNNNDTTVSIFTYNGVYVYEYENRISAKLFIKKIFNDYDLDDDLDDEVNLDDLVVYWENKINKSSIIENWEVDEMVEDFKYIGDFKYIPANITLCKKSYITIDNNWEIANKFIKQ